MTTIAARVRDLAQSNPSGVFCTFLVADTVERITFAALFGRACAYAREYRARGVKVGDVVIIILQHSPHLFYSFVGALLAGAIPSFMPFPSPKQKVAAYWKDHQTLFARIVPRLIVTYDANALAIRSAITDLSIDTLIAADELLLDDVALEEFPGLASASGDIACLQHSSGTTALKKGVVLSHRSIIEQVAAYGKALKLTPHDRVVSWLPLYHDMGFVACFMLPLIEGIELVALDPFEWVMRPQRLLAAIEIYRPTLCWLPNFAFSHLVNAVRPNATFDLCSIRAFINCSEPCKPGTFDRFVRRFATSGMSLDRLHVCYALAENVFAVSQSDLDRPVPTICVDAEALSLGQLALTADPGGYRLISCGVVLDGVTVEVRSPDGQRAAAAQIGEIFLSSPFLFEGYYLQPELAAQKLQDGWYSTGDMGALHEGELYVTGRLDDMLIVNGRNYYAHEIETVVSDIEGVIPGRCVALGIADERSDATVVVVMAESSGESLTRIGTVRDIRREMLERFGLAAHSVMLLEPGQLVKTTSGKISRTKNKEMYIEQHDRRR